MKKSNSAIQPSFVTSAAALPCRHLRVCSSRGFARSAAEGHRTESLIWKR